MSRHGCFKSKLKIENEKAAFEALKGNVKYGKAWDKGQRILCARNLDHALRLFGFTITRGTIEFLGGRDARQDRLFAAIAPHVSVGNLSFTDGDLWYEYYFTGGGVVPYVTPNE